MTVKLDINAIDEVIHGRLRLGVMTYLANAESADFNELLNVLDASKGNLSIQMRKLEEAGYVTIDKGYLGRRPHTRLRLTSEGRKAFAAYLDALDRLLPPR